MGVALLVFILLSQVATGIAAQASVPAAPEARQDPNPGCQSELAAGLDRERLTILRVSVPADDPRRRLFVEDLQELLVSGGYQLLSPTGELASTLPGPCVAWRIEVDLDGGGEPRFSVHRFGDLIAAGSRCCASTLGVFGDFRRAIAAALDLARPKMAASLVEPESAEFGLRIEAMGLFAAGRVGEAARHLEAGRLVENDSALSFRLGRILASWGSDLLASGPTPFLSRIGLSSATRLEGQARQRLKQALVRLDRAIEIDPGLAMAHLDRAKVHLLLGRSELAERSFRRARLLWPTLCEVETGLAPVRAFEAAMAPDWCGP